MSFFRKLVKKPSKPLAIIFIAIMLIVTYAPILLIIVFSLSTTKTIGDWEKYKFSIEPFIKVFDDYEAVTAFRNSMLLGLSASLLATLIGTFSAIGLFNLKRKFRSPIEFTGQITMFNADIVTAFAMLAFFMFLHLESDWIRLILAHTVICLPYVVMSILPRLTQLDPNVYEAGLDLGASPGRTLFTVIMPQLIGAMIAGFALAFTISMDDFTLSVFVGSNVSTIPSLLYSQLPKGGITEGLRAISTIIIVGIMAVLILINLLASRRNKQIAKNTMELGKNKG